jgi:hypothetical protein
MKFRHAAAIALTGWYLMTPPLQDWLMINKLSADAKAGVTGQDYSWMKMARLSLWENLAPFDSAAQCYAALAALRQKADPEPHSEAKNQTQYEARMAQCIASDDPRLKEK